MTVSNPNHLEKQEQDEVRKIFPFYSLCYLGVTSRVHLKFKCWIFITNEIEKLLLIEYA